MRVAWSSTSSSSSSVAHILIISIFMKTDLLGGSTSNYLSALNRDCHWCGKLNEMKQLYIFKCRFQTLQNDTDWQKRTLNKQIKPSITTAMIWFVSVLIISRVTRLESLLPRFVVVSPLTGTNSIKSSFEHSIITYSNGVRSDRESHIK